MPAVDPVVAGGSQTMMSKLGVSRQAALKRVASSDKELTEDYEKQERCVTANVAAAGRLLASDLPCSCSCCCLGSVRL